MSSLDSHSLWTRLERALELVQNARSDPVRQQMHLDIVENLIKEDPSVLEQRFVENSFTPLNYACLKAEYMFGAYRGVIKRLVERCPNALTLADRHGYLPLHRICASRSGATLDIIQLFVSNFPDSVKAKTKEDQTPLHLAVEEELSLDVIQFLKQQYPEALLDQDEDGMTPLHIVCRRPSQQYHHELMQLVYDPRAARKQLQRGTPPLYSACLKENVPAITFLLDRDPVLLIAVNEQNATPGDNFYCENKRRLKEMNRQNWDIFNLTTWSDESYECLQTAARALIAGLFYKHEKTLPQMKPNVIAEHLAKLLETRPFPTQHQLPYYTTGKELHVCTKTGKRRVYTKLQICNQLQKKMCQPTFQALLQGYRNMIRIDKSDYLRNDPGNKAKCLVVLISTAGGVDKKKNNVPLLFQQLRANSLLCNRVLSTSSGSVANRNEQKQPPNQTKRRRKRKAKEI